MQKAQPTEQGGLHKPLIGQFPHLPVPTPRLVPVKATVCGLVPALFVRISLPLHSPTAGGRKLTLMVQLAPASNLLPQLFV